MTVDLQGQASIVDLDAMPVTCVMEVCEECTISVFPYIVKNDLGKR